MSAPWFLQVFCESNGCWCRNESSTKKYLKLTLFPNISERDLKQPNFKQKLYQTISEEASLTKKSKKISTKNHFKRNLHNHFLHETGKSILMTSKNMFSADCISSEFCQLFFAMFQTLWWRYFFIFLVESFLQVFFCGGFSSYFVW